jgi:predicted nucleotidyltransferase
MKNWPEFDHNGDLPVGIHEATLDDVLQHFGTGTVQRRLIGQRLERIYRLVSNTGQVARFVVFGSFVTAKPDPGDVDIFMLMEDSFDSNQVGGEAAIIFDHLAVQNLEGASVFWIRRLAAIDGDQEALEHWQIKRDKTRRGIVEVISDDSERSGT